jgi:hypothetical protein
MELIYSDHNTEWTKGWFIYKTEAVYTVTFKDEIKVLEIESMFQSESLDECINYITNNNK